jgi:hypothetical protein
VARERRESRTTYGCRCREASRDRDAFRFAGEAGEMLDVTLEPGTSLIADAWLAELRVLNERFT